MKMPKNGVKPPKEIIDLINNRLLFYGYKVTEVDNFSLTFAIEKAYNNIYHRFNIKEIPRTLYPVFAERVCGEFFFSMHNTLSVGEFLGMFSSEEETQEETQEEIPEDVEVETETETTLTSSSSSSLDISSIKIGDTTISYNTSSTTTEDDIENFIDDLREYGESELLCLRKLRW